MPLSECIPTLRTGQSLRNKLMSDLPSAFPNADLVDFQWDGGEIFMEDQQSKHRKTDSSFDVAVHSPVGGITIQQEPEDDLANWLNHTTEDYGFEFLSESTNQTGGDDSVFPKIFAAGSGTAADCDLGHRTQMGLQWNGLVSDSKSTNPTWELPDSKVQMEVQISPASTRTGSGLVNFSHFARPVSRPKPNLQNVDRMKSNEKASTTAPSTRSVESTPSGDPKSILLQEQLLPAKPKKNQGSDGSNKNKIPPTINLPISPSASSKQEDLGKCSDPIPTMLVSSSSSNHRHRFKRKTHEEASAIESGYQSDDVDDDDPTVTKKTAIGRGGSNPKRSRAAEVHNLSERRRRDRINEKMRALQDLIPNCNKVDKASMLDEAIEYLKTLQFQVQIMSMSGGVGLCMQPAMMLPQTMQHPQMAHFSPMGYGMGMGMFDMKSPPMFQMSPAIPGASTTANSVGFPIYGHPSMSMNHLPSFTPLPTPMAGLNSCPVNRNSEIGSSKLLETENPTAVGAVDGNREPGGTQI